MFLALSFQIHLYKGNHNYHSCFYTLKTSDSNTFLPCIRQYLRQKKQNKTKQKTRDYGHRHNVIYVEADISLVNILV